MTPEIFHHKGVCQATSFRDRTSKLDFLAGGASTRGVTLGSIMLFYSSPAQIVAAPLSTRHVGHQSPSHQLGRMLVVISQGVAVVKGVGAVCGESFAAAKKSDLFFWLATIPDVQSKSKSSASPQKKNGFVCYLFVA